MVEAGEGCVILTTKFTLAAMTRKLSSAFSCALLLACAALPAWSHQGESHGVAEIVSARQYEPRAEAATGQVEVTAIARADQLWVFVDHRQDNSPWAGLKVEVESGAHKAAAQPLAPGAYRAAADWLNRPGKHLLTLTLQGEGIEELLSAELTIPAQAVASGSESPPTAAPPWTWWAGAAVAVVLGFGWFMRRRPSS